MGQFLSPSLYVPVQQTPLADHDGHLLLESILVLVKHHNNKLQYIGHRNN
jgi:hypothetical protein